MAFWDLNGRLKQPCECASAALTGESGGRGGSVSSLPIILCATGELDGAREVDGRSGPCFDTHQRARAAVSDRRRGPRAGTEGNLPKPAWSTLPLFSDPKSAL